MSAPIDKDTIKDALRELIHEEPDLFRNLLKEVLLEEKPDDTTFEHFIQQNFRRFDATFRALA